jgi:hypothetical protein
MARLPITEAAKVTGVSRVTLFRHIKAGRLSRHPDGTIDTAELQRDGFTLKHATVTTEVTPQLVATPPATEQYLERIIATLHDERDTLKRQLEQAVEREAFLLRLLEQAQTQNTRLLDMPRQAPAPQQRQTATDLRQRILDFMRRAGKAVRPGEVQEALGLATTVRHVMRRMVERGLLRRVDQGVYDLSEERGI